MSNLKKASLSLSINAVVILVLAIAMLGLGLGFTKKMFSKFGDTLAIPEPELTASESEPIVLVGDAIDIKYNKDTSLPVKYYSGVDGCFRPVISCSGSDIEGAGQSISQAEQKTWRILIPKNTLGNATNICTLWMEENDAPACNGAWKGPVVGDDSKQISIMVSGTPNP